MSFWFYRREGKGRRKLYSAEITNLIMIMMVLIAILAGIIVPRLIHSH